MRKRRKKLQLNRESILALNRGLERVAGAAPSDNTFCLACPSVKCEGGTDTGILCTNSVCSDTCATGGACTVGC